MNIEFDPVALPPATKLHACGVHIGWYIRDPWAMPTAIEFVRYADVNARVPDLSVGSAAGY